MSLEQLRDKIKKVMDSNPDIWNDPLNTRGWFIGISKNNTIPSSLYIGCYSRHISVSSEIIQKLQQLHLAITNTLITVSYEDENCPYDDCCVLENPSSITKCNPKCKIILYLGEWA